MKNVFRALAVFCCFSASIAVADRQTFDETKTRIALPLPTAPTIDGVIDLENESWTYAGGSSAGAPYWTMRFNEDEEDFIRGASIDNGGPGPFAADDFGADIYIGYDDENLYIAVRVIDDFIITDSAEAESVNGNTWQDDSIEVFVDGDNSNFDTRDTTGTNAELVDTGGQFVVTANNAIRHAEAGNPSYGVDGEWYGLAAVAANGNIEYEVRISLDKLGNPQPGDIIGFDINVNDADSDGDIVDNQYIWSGDTHVESTYGNLVLGPRSYTAPMVSTAPTVDGTISAGEYGDAETISITSYTGNYDIDDNGFEAAALTWPLGDHDWNAWVVHDDSAIYVAVDVIDDVIVTDTAEAGTEDGNTWEDDSVEIFFDSDNSDDNGRNTENLFEGQFVFTPNGAWRDAEANNPTFGENDDWFAATSTTATGYQIEFAVQESALFEPADVLGFDIAVNDEDAEIRKTQIAWNGRPHTERSYGNLTLAGDGGTFVSDWSLY